MNETPKVLTERIDDFVLLIELLKQMGMVDLKVIIENSLSVIGYGKRIIPWKKLPDSIFVKQILQMIAWLFFSEN